ncbi:MAG: hypothetical protein FD167_217 [bacterium]|nr:MAG: hypothetical protein FD167_217 [bacterium]
MPTRNQAYATSAYAQVSNVPDGEKSKYGSMSHKLPVLIHKAGLAQALAFVEAKAAKEDAWKRLLEDVAITINKPNLIALSRSTQLNEYMQLTSEVLAALLWYKRFAQSVLNVNAGDSHNSEHK